MTFSPCCFVILRRSRSSKVFMPYPWYLSTLRRDAGHQTWIGSLRISIIFMFTLTWGDDPIWGTYFSNGLKPPTSYWMWWKSLRTIQMVRSIHESCMWNACQSGMLRCAMSLCKMQVIETLRTFLSTTESAIFYHQFSPSALYIGKNFAISSGLMWYWRTLWLCLDKPLNWPSQGALPAMSAPISSMFPVIQRLQVPASGDFWRDEIDGCFQK